MKFSLFNFLLFAFILVLGLDPADAFRLKIPLFIIIFLYLVVKKKPSNNLLLSFMSLLLIQLLSFISGRLFCDMPYEPAMAIQYLKTSLTFVLLLWYKDLPLYKNVVPVAFIIALISIAGASLMRLQSDFVPLLLQFQEAHGAPYMMADREFFGSNYPVFIYKSIPFLFIPASVFLYNYLRNKNVRDLWKSFVLLFCICFCGNRTLMLSSFLIIFLNLLVLFKNNRFLKRCSLLIVPVILYYSAIASIDLFVTNAGSGDEIRLGHLESYTTYFEQNVGTVIFGAGPGSMIYSRGLSELTTQTEFTYIECFRYFGIIGGLVFLWFFFRPLVVLYKLRQKVEYCLPALFGYLAFLVLSGSNPYLMGSDGLVMVLIAYEFAYRHYESVKSHLTDKKYCYG